MKKLEKCVAIFLCFTLFDLEGMAAPAFEPRSKALPTFIHIRDLHCNESAQLDIARIVETVARSGFRVSGKDVPGFPFRGSRNNESINYAQRETRNDLLVLVEGAEGPVDTSLFGSFPDRNVREKAAREFLKEGKMTGPEYLSIVHHGEIPIRIVGIEDGALYRENLKAYREVMKSSQEVKRFMADEARRLRKLKEKVFSEELLELDQRWEEYRSGKLTLEVYVRYLTSSPDVPSGSVAGGLINDPRKTGLTQTMADSRTPNINLLIRVLEAQKRIDLRKVEKEQNELMQELSQKLPREELARLIKKSLEFRLGKITEVEYLGELERLGKGIISSQDVRLSHRDKLHSVTPLARSDESVGPPWSQASSTPLRNDPSTKQFPTLVKYIEFIKLHSQIDYLKLSEELENIAHKLTEKLVRTEEEREVLKLSRNADVLGRMLRLEATREELKAVTGSALPVSGKIVTGSAFRVSGKIVSRFPFRGSRNNESINYARRETRNGKRFSVLSPDGSQKIETVYKSAKRFYELALKREEAMVGKAMKIVTGSALPVSGNNELIYDGQRIVVLITGGFHSDGITDLLREKGIQCKVITPKVSGKINSKKYQNLMMDSRISSETMAYVSLFNRLAEEVSEPLQAVELGRLLERYFQIMRLKGMPVSVLSSWVQEWVGSKGGYPRLSKVQQVLVDYLRERLSLPDAVSKVTHPLMGSEEVKKLIWNYSLTTAKLTIEVLKELGDEALLSYAKSELRKRESQIQYGTRKVRAPPSVRIEPFVLQVQMAMNWLRRLFPEHLKLRMWIENIIAVSAFTSLVFAGIVVFRLGLVQSTVLALPLTSMFVSLGHFDIYKFWDRFYVGNILFLPFVLVPLLLSFGITHFLFPFILVALGGLIFYGSVQFHLKLNKMIEARRIPTRRGFKALLFDPPQHYYWQTYGEGRESRNFVLPGEDYIIKIPHDGHAYDYEMAYHAIKEELGGISAPMTLVRTPVSRGIPTWRGVIHTPFVIVQQRLEPLPRGISGKLRRDMAKKMRQKIIQVIRLGFHHMDLLQEDNWMWDPVTGEVYLVDLAPFKEDNQFDIGLSQWFWDEIGHGPGVVFGLDADKPVPVPDFIQGEDPGEEGGDFPFWVPLVRASMPWLEKLLPHHPRTRAVIENLIGAGIFTLSTVVGVLALGLSLPPAALLSLPITAVVFGLLHFESLRPLKWRFGIQAEKRILTNGEDIQFQESLQQQGVELPPGKNIFMGEVREVQIDVAPRPNPLPLFVDVSPDMSTIRYYEIPSDQKVEGFVKGIDDGKIEPFLVVEGQFLITPSPNLLPSLLEQAKSEDERQKIKAMMDFNENYGKRYLRYGAQGQKDKIIVSWDKDVDKGVWTSMIDTVYFHNVLFQSGVLSLSNIQSAVEVGTGGGHLAAVLAQAYPEMRDLYYTDISPYALRAAKLHVSRYAADSLKQHPYLGAGFKFIRGPTETNNKFDLILCNPPYIPIPDFEEQKAEDPYRGTRLIEEMMEYAAEKLNDQNPNAQMIMSVSSMTQPDMEKYIERYGDRFIMEPLGPPMMVPLKIYTMSEKWREWFVSKGLLKKHEDAVEKGIEPYSHAIQAFRIRLRTPEERVLKRLGENVKAMMSEPTKDPREINRAMVKKIKEEFPEVFEFFLTREKGWCLRLKIDERDSYFQMTQEGEYARMERNKFLSQQLRIPDRSLVQVFDHHVLPSGLSQSKLWSWQDFENWKKFKLLNWVHGRLIDIGRRAAFLRQGGELFLDEKTMEALTQEFETLKNLEAQISASRAVEIEEEVSRRIADSSLTFNGERMERYESLFLRIRKQLPEKLVQLESQVEDAELKEALGQISERWALYDLELQKLDEFYSGVNGRTIVVDETFWEEVMQSSEPEEIVMELISRAILSDLEGGETPNNFVLGRLFGNRLLEVEENFLDSSRTRSGISGNDITPKYDVMRLFSRLSPRQVQLIYAMVSEDPTALFSPVEEISSADWELLFSRMSDVVQMDGALSFVGIEGIFKKMREELTLRVPNEAKRLAYEKDLQDLEERLKLLRDWVLENFNQLNLQSFEAHQLIWLSQLDVRIRDKFLEKEFFKESALEYEVVIDFFNKIRALDFVNRYGHPHEMREDTRLRTLGVDKILAAYDSLKTKGRANRHWYMGDFDEWAWRQGIELKLQTPFDDEEIKSETLRKARSEALQYLMHGIQGLPKALLMGKLKKPATINIRFHDIPTHLVDQLEPQLIFAHYRPGTVGDEIELEVAGYPGEALAGAITTLIHEILHKLALSYAKQGGENLPIEDFQELAEKSGFKSYFEIARFNEKSQVIPEGSDEKAQSVSLEQRSVSEIKSFRNRRRIGYFHYFWVDPQGRKMCFIPIERIRAEPVVQEALKAHAVEIVASGRDTHIVTSPEEVIAVVGSESADNFYARVNSKLFPPEFRNEILKILQRRLLRSSFSVAERVDGDPIYEIYEPDGDKGLITKFVDPVGNKFATLEEALGPRHSHLEWLKLRRPASSAWRGKKLEGMTVDSLKEEVKKESKHLGAIQGKDIWVDRELLQRFSQFKRPMKDGRWRHFRTQQEFEDYLMKFLAERFWHSPPKVDVNEIVIGLLSSATHASEDHEKNGFIGISDQLFAGDISDELRWKFLLVDLRHELMHESGLGNSHAEEKQLLAQDAKFAHEIGMTLEELDHVKTFIVEPAFLHALFIHESLSKVMEQIPDGGRDLRERTHSANLLDLKYRVFELGRTREIAAYDTHDIGLGTLIKTILGGRIDSSYVSDFVQGAYFIDQGFGIGRVKVDKIYKAGQHGPYFILVNSKQEGWQKRWFHQVYLVPEESDRRILYAMLEEAVKKNLIPRMHANAARAKVLTYAEFLGFDDVLKAKVGREKLLRERVRRYARRALSDDIPPIEMALQLPEILQAVGTSMKLNNNIMRWFMRDYIPEISRKSEKKGDGRPTTQAGEQKLVGTPALEISQVVEAVREVPYREVNAWERHLAKEILEAIGGHTDQWLDRELRKLDLNQRKIGFDALKKVLKAIQEGQTEVEVEYRRETYKVVLKLADGPLDVRVHAAYYQEGNTLNIALARDHLDALPHELMTALLLTQEGNRSPSEDSSKWKERAIHTQMVLLEPLFDADLEPVLRTITGEVKGRMARELFQMRPPGWIELVDGTRQALKDIDEKEKLGYLSARSADLARSLAKSITRRASSGISIYGSPNRRAYEWNPTDIEFVERLLKGMKPVKYDRDRNRIREACELVNQKNEGKGIAVRPEEVALHTIETSQWGLPRFEGHLSVNLAYSYARVEGDGALHIYVSARLWERYLVEPKEGEKFLAQIIDYHWSRLKEGMSDSDAEARASHYIDQTGLTPFQQFFVDEMANHGDLGRQVLEEVLVESSLNPATSYPREGRFIHDAEGVLVQIPSIAVPSINDEAMRLRYGERLREAVGLELPNVPLLAQGLIQELGLDPLLALLERIKAACRVSGPEKIKFGREEIHIHQILAITFFWDVLPVVTGLLAGGKSFSEISDDLVAMYGAVEHEISLTRDDGEGSVRISIPIKGVFWALHEFYKGEAHLYWDGVKHMVLNGGYLRKGYPSDLALATLKRFFGKNLTFFWPSLVALSEEMPFYAPSVFGDFIPAFWRLIKGPEDIEKVTPILREIAMQLRSSGISSAEDKEGLRKFDGFIRVMSSLAHLVGDINQLEGLSRKLSSLLDQADPHETELLTLISLIAPEMESLVDVENVGRKAVTRFDEPFARDLIDILGLGEGITQTLPSGATLSDRKSFKKMIESSLARKLGLKTDRELWTVWARVSDFLGSIPESGRKHVKRIIHENQYLISSVKDLFQMLAEIERLFREVKGVEGVLGFYKFFESKSVRPLIREMRDFVIVWRWFYELAEKLGDAKFSILHAVGILAKEGVIDATNFGKFMSLTKMKQDTRWCMPFFLGLIQVTDYLRRLKAEGKLDRFLVFCQRLVVKKGKSAGYILEGILEGIKDGMVPEDIVEKERETELFDFIEIMNTFSPELFSMYRLKQGDDRIQFVQHLSHVQDRIRENTVTRELLEDVQRLIAPILPLDRILDFWTAVFMTVIPATDASYLTRDEAREMVRQAFETSNDFATTHIPEALHGFFVERSIHVVKKEKDPSVDHSAALNKWLRDMIEKTEESVENVSDDSMRQSLLDYYAKDISDGSLSQTLEKWAFRHPKLKEKLEEAMELDEKRRWEILYSLLSDEINTWLQIMISDLKPSRSKDELKAPEKIIQQLERMRGRNADEIKNNMRSLLDRFESSGLRKLELMLDRIRDEELKGMVREVIQEVVGHRDEDERALLKNLVEGEDKSRLEQHLRDYLRRYGIRGLGEVRNKISGDVDAMPLARYQVLRPLLDQIMREQSMYGALASLKDLSRIIDGLWGPQIKLLKEELDSYERVKQDGKTKKEKLTLRIVKSIPYALWGYNSGVCTARDVELWNDPNFMLLGFFNPEGVMVGSASLYTKMIDGRKILTIPGIEPTTDYIDSVNADELLEIVEATLIDIAHKGEYDAIYIPTDKAINSNRHAMQVAIERRYQGMIRKEDFAHLKMNQKLLWDELTKKGLADVRGLIWDRVGEFKSPSDMRLDEAFRVVEGEIFEILKSNFKGRHIQLSEKIEWNQYPQSHDYDHVYVIWNRAQEEALLTSSITATLFDGENTWLKNLPFQLGFGLAIPVQELVHIGLAKFLGLEVRWGLGSLWSAVQVDYTRAPRWKEIIVKSGGLLANLGVGLFLIAFFGLPSFSLLGAFTVMNLGLFLSDLVLSRIRRRGDFWEVILAFAHYLHLHTLAEHLKEGTEISLGALVALQAHWSERLRFSSIFSQKLLWQLRDVVRFWDETISYFVTRQFENFEDGVVALVTNALDAGTGEVHVSLKENEIIVADAGTGIFPREVFAKLFIPTYTTKEDGAKTLGRFGTAFLSALNYLKKPDDFLNIVSFRDGQGFRIRVGIKDEILIIRSVEEDLNVESIVPYIFPGFELGPHFSGTSIQIVSPSLTSPQVGSVRRAISERFKYWRGSPIHFYDAEGRRTEVIGQENKFGKIAYVSRPGEGHLVITHQGMKLMSLPIPGSHVPKEWVIDFPASSRISASRGRIAVSEDTITEILGMVQKIQDDASMELSEKFSLLNSLYYLLKWMEGMQPGLIQRDILVTVADSLIKNEQVELQGLNESKIFVPDIIQAREFFEGVKGVVFVNPKLLRELQFAGLPPEELETGAYTKTLQERGLKVFLVETRGEKPLFRWGSRVFIPKNDLVNPRDIFWQNIVTSVAVCYWEYMVNNILLAEDMRYEIPGVLEPDKLYDQIEQAGRVPLPAGLSKKGELTHRGQLSDLIVGFFKKGRVLPLEPIPMTQHITFQHHIARGLIRRNINDHRLEPFDFVRTLLKGSRDAILRREGEDLTIFWEARRIHMGIRAVRAESGDENMRVEFTMRHPVGMTMTQLMQDQLIPNPDSFLSRGLYTALREADEIWVRTSQGDGKITALRLIPEIKDDRVSDVFYEVYEERGSMNETEFVWHKRGEASGLDFVLLEERVKASVRTMDLPIPVELNLQAVPGLNHKRDWLTEFDASGGQRGKVYLDRGKMSVVAQKGLTVRHFDRSFIQDVLGIPPERDLFQWFVRLADVGIILELPEGIRLMEDAANFVASDLHRERGVVVAALFDAAIRLLLSGELNVNAQLGYDFLINPDPEKLIDPDGEDGGFAFKIRRPPRHDLETLSRFLLHAWSDLANIAKNWTLYPGMTLQRFLSKITAIAKRSERMSRRVFTEWLASKELMDYLAQEGERLEEKLEVALSAFENISKRYFPILPPHFAENKKKILNRPNINKVAREEVISFLLSQVVLIVREMHQYSVKTSINEIVRGITYRVLRLRMDSDDEGTVSGSTPAIEMRMVKHLTKKILRAKPILLEDISLAFQRSPLEFRRNLLNSKKLRDGIGLETVERYKTKLPHVYFFLRASRVIVEALQASSRRMFQEDLYSRGTEVRIYADPMDQNTQAKATLKMIRWHLGEETFNLMRNLISYLAKPSNKSLESFLSEMIETLSHEMTHDGEQKAGWKGTHHKGFFDREERLLGAALRDPIFHRELGKRFIALSEEYRSLVQGPVQEVVTYFFQNMTPEDNVAMVRNALQPLSEDVSPKIYSVDELKGIMKGLVYSFLGEGLSVEKILSRLGERLAQFNIPNAQRDELLKWVAKKVVEEVRRGALKTAQFGGLNLDIGLAGKDYVDRAA